MQLSGKLMTVAIISLTLMVSASFSQAFHKDLATNSGNSTNTSTHREQKDEKRWVTLQSTSYEPLARGRVMIRTAQLPEQPEVKSFYLTSSNLKEGEIYWLYIDNVAIDGKKVLMEPDVTSNEVPGLVFNYSASKIDKLHTLLNTSSNIDRVELRNQNGKVVLFANING